jgi:pimeloyl-ACP methyl ester carboxylesterase
VIAPDHLGFGYSAMPPADSFEYSFAALASLTIAFTEKLGLTSYATFVQDYGEPIGWRMALEHPERITAIITQNGNAYKDGVVDKVWAEVVAYDAAPSPETPRSGSCRPGISQSRPTPPRSPAFARGCRSWSVGTDVSGEGRPVGMATR